jgi:hypothetical protein
MCFTYPGNTNILRIARTANIKNQNRKIFIPFDNFGSFIRKEIELI